MWWPQNKDQELNNLIREIDQTMESLLKAHEEERAESEKQAEQALSALIKKALSFEDDDLLELSVYCVGLLSPEEGARTVKELLNPGDGQVAIRAMNVAAYGLDPNAAEQLLKGARDIHGIKPFDLPAHGDYSLGQIIGLRKKALEKFGTAESA